MGANSDISPKRCKRKKERDRERVGSRGEGHGKYKEKVGKDQKEKREGIESG